ncbi:protein of unknown function [Kyrpidia spormannii]|uniref:Uncharacterized protein n=1 Tax=Kyrpidia spormannii TaxID=2055160 RepID=A0ACA8Z6I9_9BACL|nr:protein of unknown function [Kyrpidia spormannii]
METSCGTRVFSSRPSPHPASRPRSTCPIVVHPFGAAIGIDRGSAHFAGLSDGTFVDAPGWVRRYEAKLIWEMRKLSRSRLGKEDDDGGGEDSSAG